MPRFYFDIFLGGKAIWDQHGEELPSLGDAEVNARRAAGELSRDYLQKARLDPITVQVRDEERALLLWVTVAMAVHRTGSVAGAE